MTTNVDTLIETASMPLLGQIGVGIDGHAVAGLTPDQSPLLKIHGCRVIDPANTVWAPGQLDADPVCGRIECSAAWLGQQLLNRDLIIIGYSTDWDYLNAVLGTALGAVNPARVLVINPAESAKFAEKAPELVTVGNRATNGFSYLKASGADFLAELRLAFSKSFVRQVISGGRDEFADVYGEPPCPPLLEPPDIDNEQYWLMRRDLLGCLPSEPADRSFPPDEPLLGLTVLQLRSAGAVADGSYWKIGGQTVRVIRTPNSILHRIEAAYRNEVAPAAAPDIVIAVGAESMALHANIARSGGDSARPGLHHSLRDGELARFPGSDGLFGTLFPQQRRP